MLQRQWSRSVEIKPKKKKLNAPGTSAFHREIMVRKLCFALFRNEFFCRHKIAWATARTK